MKQRKSKGKNITVSPEAYEVFFNLSTATKPHLKLRQQLNIAAGVPINS